MLILDFCLCLGTMSRKKSRESKKGFSKSEKIAIPVIILVAAWVVYSLVHPNLPPQQVTSSTTVLSSSSNALDFTLPVIGPNGPTGKSLSLSSLQGRVVILEFMEPSCPHCQTMAPILEELHQKYGDNVTFVSIAGPWEGTKETDVAKFVRDYGSSWTYVYDSTGITASKYGVNATPTFFVIGKKGAILTSLQGQQSYDTLEGLIVESLRSQ